MIWMVIFSKCKTTYIDDWSKNVRPGSVKKALSQAKLGRALISVSEETHGSVLISFSLIFKLPNNSSGSNTPITKTLK